MAYARGGAALLFSEMVSRELHALVLEVRFL